MVRTLVIAAAIGLAAAALIEGRTASADDLVPGGLLEPTQPAKPPPPQPPAATPGDNLVPGGWLQPTQPPAPPTPTPAAEPTEQDQAPEARRPMVRSRVRERRPTAPKPEAPPSDGKIRF